MHCGLRWLLLGFKLPEDALVSVEREELKQRSKSLGRVCLVPGGGGDEGGGVTKKILIALNLSGTIIISIMLPTVNSWVIGIKKKKREIFPSRCICK